MNAPVVCALALRDYALIGDCHGAALVGRNGSLDWCCFDRFDADPCFWRLVDPAGPALRIAPQRPEAAANRRYRPDTNLLETSFEVGAAVLVVTDFMPVWCSDAVGGTHLEAPGVVVRMVEAHQGDVLVRATLWRSATGFRGATTARFPLSVLSDIDIPNEDFDIEFVVRAGQRHCFVLSGQVEVATRILKEVDQTFARTEQFWTQWRAQGRYVGPYTDAVYRSALTLKMLTFAPTGAIVAAPTTSLPEVIGGSRNWDYRYSWIRDAAFTLHALAVLGYATEAQGFCEFLRLCCVGTGPRMQIMYGIGGERDLPEVDLTHLAGYAGSRPVRVGNAAYLQRQADMYGELLDWAHLYHSLGAPVDKVLGQMVHEAADAVCRNWRQPDHGLWEARTPPRHYVYSKLMMWVALDRAIELMGAQRGWLETRDALLADIRAHGVSSNGHLVQCYGSDEMDASLLLTPFLGVPLERSVVDATLAAVEQRLRQGDYVRRYLSDDGLPGHEGAFLMCSFWLVDALLVQGRGEDGRALFERLLTRANDVGLYAEEMEVEDHAFLGNFPQAFTHLALINSAVNLELYAQGGAAALCGTHADRAARDVAPISRTHISS